MMKKKMGWFLCVLSALLLITGCSGEPAFIGSLDTEGFSVDVPVYESLESMVDASELIVIGRVDGDAEVIPGEKMTTTIYPFAVDETLKGSETKKVQFFQLGADGSDEFETKLKKGRTYVLFLMKNYTRETETGETEVIYNSISFEQGIFEVNGAGKLKAYTTLGEAPRMQDMKLSELKEKIRSLNG